ncbi:SDR family NAD(P)-dependent oxidoreductase [Chryseobacterium carnipullorum]|uniref:Fatty acyl-CoA reductase n=1 Tax=Chryseobacterium carnipullorum TaxID=1124835 RepID=A0A376DS44_CHRCU|nr:SDR family NAD(P)-dependent oxidoreductase [Chryseobacterium carnipullorum]AZA48935.1 SDR family NAD(P)-dependent oxidoreductase [Chryseobacterium carnipullorum]AZA63834.1 SDR family NAD(P)-dependent oxidoreductase [Chryseobacterium carnipullorum]STC93582.1 Fatty acyl-CoA reductase [Chryseobacterium carnipullorum]
MNITNNIILITGGGSGIGLEIAKALHTSNKVIIAGRNKAKLDAASAGLENIFTIQADITDEKDVERLVEEIKVSFGGLNILINNAGHAYVYTLSDTSDTYHKATAEFETNYFAPIRLTEKLLPLLKKQENAAVVNVSSIVALAPGSHLPTYSDSKAALHSYTKLLRYELAKDTPIKVFELMPPLVNTDFSVEIGGRENGIPASEVAENLVKGLLEDTYEIRVGNTEVLYSSFFAGSEGAFDVMNQ